MTVLDIDANNLVVCTITTGEQYLYEGHELFQRFRETTREIARFQSKLEEDRYSSDRIRRLYRKRIRRRNHAQEALCRDLLERLYEDGVDTVYIGGLTDVLETHWSVEINAKTHNFWSFKNSPNDWSAPPRNTVSQSRFGRKRGPVKSARNAVRHTERHDIRTHSPARVDSRVTPTSRHQKRS